MNHCPTINDVSENELEELCRVASDVPRLWDHPAMTHQERKAILRCIIDHVVVAVTRERIDATICWNSGEQTKVSIWRLNGRDNLIRELRAQGEKQSPQYARMKIRLPAVPEVPTASCRVEYELMKPLTEAPAEITAVKIPIPICSALPHPEEDQ